MNGRLMLAIVTAEFSANSGAPAFAQLIFRERDGPVRVVVTRTAAGPGRDAGDRQHDVSRTWRTPRVWPMTWKPVLFLIEKEFTNLRADFEGLLRAEFSWADPGPGISAAVANFLLTWPSVYLFTMVLAL